MCTRNHNTSTVTSGHIHNTAFLSDVSFLNCLFIICCAYYQFSKKYFLLIAMDFRRRYNACQGKRRLQIDLLLSSKRVVVVIYIYIAYWKTVLVIGIFEWAIIFKRYTIITRVRISFEEYKRLY